MTLVDGLLQPTIDALRALRQWHWNEYERHTRHERRWNKPFPSYQKRYTEHRRKATFHLLAVQALNDVFPPGDYIRVNDANL